VPKETDGDSRRRPSGRRPSSRRPGKGPIGTRIAVGILCLMTLSSQAGGAAPLHGANLYLPPYRSVATGSIPVHVAIGCARSDGRPLTWQAISGRIDGIGSAWSKDCVKSHYNGNSVNSARWSSQIGLSFPVAVSSSGNHSVALNWTITLGTRSYSTTGGCPVANLNFGIGVGNSSVGYCESGTDLGFYLWAVLEDPNGAGGFVGNISDAGNDNYTYWENVSSCTNGGSLSCSNWTYGYQFLLAYGTNEVGSTSSGLGGPHQITMWANGTGMVKTDHFELVVGFYVYASSYASTASLARPWHAGAGAAVDLTAFGNGAVLNSITVR
jgi:hypothetical protein